MREHVKLVMGVFHPLHTQWFVTVGMGTWHVCSRVQIAEVSPRRAAMLSGKSSSAVPSPCILHPMVSPAPLVPWNRHWCRGNSPQVPGLNSVDIIVASGVAGTSGVTLASGVGVSGGVMGTSTGGGVGESGVTGTSGVTLCWSLSITAASGGLLASIGDAAVSGEALHPKWAAPITDRTTSKAVDLVIVRSSSSGIGLCLQHNPDRVAKQEDHKMSRRG